jgi:peptidoglycan/LPS O-acetylase OafA/YrhL
MQRLYFVQWLRVFLISLVVAHHAAQPYGPTGGEWPVDDPASADWLGGFFTVNAAFFMGFFFLIAGYFTASSYDRKGAAAYVTDRLIRLGIPLVFFVFFVFGPLVYLFASPPEGFLSFYFGTYIGRWQIEMGPLWFIAQLLALGLLYAVWRLALSARGRSDDRAIPPPDDRAVLVYALALGLVGALVRTRYPQDAWVRILWLVPAEPAHLPQYVSLFLIGIVAGRGRWFTEIAPAVAKRWFAIGVVAFIIADNLDSLPISINRGVAWGFLEAFVCVGMILGLTVLFRRYLAAPGRWLDRLDGNVYGVYLIHFFVVWALQVAILASPLSATVKFLLVTVVGLVICFSVVAALRQIPPVRRVV